MLNVKIAIQQLSLVFFCELFEKLSVLNSELRDTLLLACWAFVRLFSSMSSLMMFLLLNSHADDIGKNGCTMFTGSSSTNCGFTWVHVEMEIKSFFSDYFHVTLERNLHNGVFEHIFHINFLLYFIFFFCEWLNDLSSLCLTVKFVI